MVLKRLFGLAIAFSLGAGGALVGSQAVLGAANVVIVSSDGQHGWHSRVTDGTGTPNATYGSVTFVTGPATPPRGIGSLRLQTNVGKGDGSAQIRNTNYMGLNLGSLTKLTYGAYHNFVPTSTNQQQWPYLSLDVSCGACAGGGDRLFFEPPFQQPGTGGPTCSVPGQSPTITNKWQIWDALIGCWWDNNGELGSGGTDTKLLSVFISSHSDAMIVNPGGLGGVRLAVGFASNTDQFDGNIDLVTVGVHGNSTSYDFEPPTCQEADGNGDFHGDHGDGNFSDDNDSCKDGDEDRVDSNNRGDGKDFHSTRIDSAEIDNVTHTITITGTGLSAGAPVSFVLIAVESNLTTPGWVSFMFSDGYSNAGTLLNGSVLLH